MRDTTLTLCQSSLSWHSVSFGLKVSLIPGLTVSLGLPYRGRDRETETGERPGREKPGIACPHRGVWGSKSWKSSNVTARQSRAQCEHSG